MGGGGKGKSKSVNVPPMGDNQYERQLADMAQSMWDQTQPVRGYFTEDWKKFFRPEEGRPYDPYQLPGYAPLYNLSRTGIEDQYDVAKENILSTLPRGGAMGRALGNLETGRAKDIGSLQASISAPLISDIYNKAYGAGWQTGPTQAIGGMGAASGTLNQRLTQQQQLQVAAAMQEAQAARAGSSAKGLGMGSMLGKGIGSAIPGIGTALGGMIGGGLGNIGSSIAGALGGGSPGITSGLGGYTALANTANPMMW